MWYAINLQSFGSMQKMLDLTKFGPWEAVSPMEYIILRFCEISLLYRIVKISKMPIPTQKYLS